MSLLTPLALLLALLLPVIIAMYLLKLRRTERVISSIYIWEQIVRDIEANAPWQRLQRNLLLILQLLFLIIIMLAIARPFTWTEGVSGKSLILIFDTSASMAAIDVAPNRLEAAKAQARQLVEKLPQTSRVTIIDAGNKAKLMLSSSNDYKQVYQTIDRIQANTAGSDLGVALQLASAIAMRQPDTQTVIFSDGNVSLPERIALNGIASFVSIGNRGDNQAIELLTLQPMPGGGNISAFAQVMNYSSSTVKRRVAFYADGQLANAYDINLTPNGEQAVLMDDLPATTHVVEARLISDNQTTDYLTADDRALAIFRDADPRSITLISRGNLFLETALTLLPGMVVTLINPQNGPSLPRADLTILDNYVPITTTLPQGNLLFIAPPQSTRYFTITGSIDTPVPQLVDPTDPIVAHINLENVNILDALRIILPAWGKPVIASDDQSQGTSTMIPLLFVGENEERRMAVLAFDLHRSDLPLQVAFPILLANLIQWLAPGVEGNIPNQVLPGNAVTISLSPGLPPSTPFRIMITRPDGTSENLEVESSKLVFADTEQLGLYQVNLSQSNTIEFAVNLFSPQESRIQPTTSLHILGTTSSEGIEDSQHNRKEWWRMCGLIALILLMFEWLFYHRPTLAMFYKRLISSLKIAGTSKS